ncbi:MAG TPA: glycosyltransferase family A protein [Dongiaceae bacterium]|nr:glycosyltransferase family A protein [Dongiaceae bacterium]
MAGLPMAQSAAMAAGLHFLERALATSGCAEPMPRAAAEALSAAATAWRQPDLPDGLVARPCPQPAACWHYDHLASGTAHDEVGRARRMFHARLLGFLLAPGLAQFRPLVSIVIPVFNRASACAEAVASCLAQSWRPLEIIVVDDGSTDDLATALHRFGDAVHVIRKENGGVSSARNMGMAAARGDFVHFLDSDNLLRPEAVARKVAAFAAIADAELCYSLSEDRGFEDRPIRVPAPTGGAGCTTSSLMRALSERYPFFPSCVMLPRWVALDTEPFEEDLRRGEDMRYWFALGLRDTKVIALGQRLTVCRMSPDSLSAAPRDPVAAALVRLRNLRDTLQSANGWGYSAGCLRALLHSSVLKRASATGDPRIARGIGEVLDAIRRLAAGEPHGALSALPVIASLRDRLCRSRASGRWRRAGPFSQDLPALLAAAASGAAPLAESDLAFWTNGAAGRSGHMPINLYMRAIARRWNHDREILDAAGWLLRHAQRIPDKRMVRILIGLRRRFRSMRFARRLALLLHRYARSSA